MEIVDLEGAREFTAAHHAQSLTRMVLCRVQAGADRQPLPPDSWPSAWALEPWSAVRGHGSADGGERRANG